MAIKVKGKLIGEDGDEQLNLEKKRFSQKQAQRERAKDTRKEKLMLKAVGTPTLDNYF